MKKMKNLLLVLALTGWVSATNAGVIIDVSEVAGDVVFTTSGSLDLTAASSLGARSYSDGFISGGSNWYVASGAGSSVDTYAMTSFDGAFGTSVSSLHPSSTSGDDFFIWGNGGITEQIGVQLGYLSSGAINSIMTFDGTTIAALNMIVGTYNYAIPSDTIQLRIGQTSSVPEPSTLILLGLGLLGLGLRRRRLLN